MTDPFVALNFMRMAADIGAKAPHADRELAVGCVITDETGNIIATGYSREDGKEKSHAEAIALSKIKPGVDVSNCILYATVEPCGTRLSDGPTCASLIIARGIKTVFYAMHEPDHFVHQDGLGRLEQTGISVTHVCDSGIFEKVANANPHIVWTA